jgi:succinyl-CoA synthetase alpha subunit
MTLQVSVRSNLYKDSVALMRIAEEVRAATGVARATLLMGTEANKAILEQAGLFSDALRAARAADLMVLVEDADDHDGSRVAAALQLAERLLAGKAAASQPGVQQMSPQSMSMAVAAAHEAGNNAGLAQISVPGAYAAAEALKAIKAGLDVFLFSDNVSLEQELAIKQLAQAHGRLVMGPDCGTAIVGGVPLGFANQVRRGRIGLVGASGTGLQEVSCQIHALGEGVSHALGTGGRDPSAAIGGISLYAAMEMLAADASTEVIVLISKPPAAPVVQGLNARMQQLAAQTGKHFVVLILGASPSAALPGITPVGTLFEAAAQAVALLRGKGKAATATRAGAAESVNVAALPKPLDNAQHSPQHSPQQRYVRGLFSGGTFCTEAQAIWQAHGLRCWSNVPLDKSLLLSDARCSQEHTAVDLGDDVFTVGRPHPMIDPQLRIERLLAEAADPTVAVILLDVVLGWGSHADPAGALAPAIRQARAIASADGRALSVIGFVTGTADDPQNLAAQRECLMQAGVTLADSSSAAAMMVLALLAQLAAAAPSQSALNLASGKAERSKAVVS